MAIARVFSPSTTHPQTRTQNPDLDTMQGGSSGIGYGLKYQVRWLVHISNPNNSRSQSSARFLNEFRVFVRRLDVYPTSKPIPTTPVFSPRLSASKKKTRLDQSIDRLSIVSFLVGSEFDRVCICRCIWFGFLRAGLSSCARACFPTRVRSGISLRVPLTSESSPLSTLLVIYGSGIFLSYTIELVHYGMGIPIYFYYAFSVSEWNNRVNNAFLSFQFSKIFIPSIFFSRKANHMKRQYGRFPSCTAS